MRCRHLIRVPVMALVAVGMSGCVAFPIAIPEKDPFEEVVEDFLQVGETTAEDVRTELGNPTLEETDWWLYRGTRQGWQWAFCAGAYYSAGCGALPRNINDSFLSVAFDDAGQVSQVMMYSKKELCREKRVCFEGQHLMRAAAEVDDHAAKQFEAPRKGCAVYTYSDTGKEGVAGELVIDGAVVGSVVGADGYHVHTVEPGWHAWIVDPDFGGAELRGFIALTSFDCSGSQVAFLRHRQGLLSNKLEQVDRDRGEADIRERWRAVPAPDTEEVVFTNWLRDEEVFVVKRDDSIAVYEFDEDKTIPRWGRSYFREPCGMRAALDKYGLQPLGSQTGLVFGESLTDVVELQGVCSAEGVCTFASAINGQFCEAEPIMEIAFPMNGKLLVVEPAGDSVNEIYYGSANALKNRADCKNRVCTIELSELRNAQ